MTTSKNYTPAQVYLISGETGYIAMVLGKEVYRLENPLQGEEIISVLCNGGDVLPINQTV